MGKYIFRVGGPCCEVPTKEPDEETIMQMLYNILVKNGRESRWEVYSNFPLRRLGDTYYLSDSEILEGFDFYNDFAYNLLWYNFKTKKGGFIENK